MSRIRLTAGCGTIFFIVLMSHFRVAHSQTRDKDSIISGYISNLTNTWLKFVPTDFSELLSSSAVKAPDLFNSSSPQNNSYKNLLLRSNYVKQRIYRKDVGLKFTAGYQENLKSPVADPEDVVVFKRKAMFGVDWDLLNNGYYDNRLKIKMLRNDYKSIEKKQYYNSLTHYQMQNTEQLIHYFNSKKIKVLEAREQLNKEQMSVIEKLWSLKHVTKDDYLKALQNRTDISSQYHVYKNYNDASGLFNTSNAYDFEAPVLDIDIAMLFERANIMSVDSAIYYENSNNLYQASYLKEMSLKAYARYNYYDVYTPGISNRSFISVGMNLGMPLAFNRKEKQEYNAIQYELLKEKNKTETEDLQFVLLNHFYEYRYKLKQYANLLEKRDVYGELLRTEKVKQQLGDLEFNPNTALFILDDYWSNTIELLDLEQDMYKILLAIKLKLPDIHLDEYTHPYVPMRRDTMINSGFRAVYIWSDAFRNNSLTVINEYCSLNEFSPILVSYHPGKAYLQQLREFIGKNYTKTIELMIGSNKLLNGGLSSYLDTLKLNMNLTFIKGIHLDLEPHTAPDFKENKEAGFAKYLDRLNEAAQFTKANKLSLSVSIPLNYPENVLKAVYEKCSTVYLMAYENTDPDFIKKKSAEEVALGKEKTVLALRAKDFKNRVEMDEHFRKLGFRKIAYHDLDDLIRFDNQSINNNQENKDK
ncbi:MAG: hypothetical protein ACJ76F_01485 [Bacteroidia bacterium]